MSTRKLKVVLTRRLPDAVETRMRELFDARLNLDDTPMSQAALAEALKTADVLVPTVTDKLDAGPMIEYFTPVNEWLKQQNEGQMCGWQANAAPAAK